MTDPALMAELRWLTGHAIAHGADPARVSHIADQLVDVLLDAQDPRRKRTLSKAERALRAYNAGTSVSALMERFGVRNRSTISRWLRVARLHATPARSNGSSQLETL